MSHTSRPESSCSRVRCPAYRLRTGDLLNGNRDVLIGFGQRSDLLLFCCTVVFVLLLLYCCCTVVLLLFCCTAVVVLYCLTVVVLL